MDKIGYRQNISIILTLILVSFHTSLVLSLRCKRCSLQECSNEQGGEDVECLPDHTDCAVSILRHDVGNLKANTVLEKRCYFANRNNKLYRKNVPHCQKNDKGIVEVCVCQGDLCNVKLPLCQLRNYGNGRTCSRN